MRRGFSSSHVAPCGWRDEGAYRAQATEKNKAALPAGVARAGEHVWIATARVLRLSLSVLCPWCSANSLEGWHVSYIFSSATCMPPQSYRSPLVFGPLLPFCLRSSSMAASTSADDSSFQRRKVTTPSFESYLWAPWVSSGYFAERRGYQRIRGVIPKLGGGAGDASYRRDRRSPNREIRVLLG